MMSDGGEPTWFSPCNVLRGLLGEAFAQRESMDARDNALDSSDVEDIVMKNLSYTSSAPEKESDLSFHKRSPKRALKRSRRKSPITSVVLPPDTTEYAENLADVAKHTEERALRVALVRSYGQRGKESVRPEGTGLNGLKVIQAPDNKEYIPRRRSRSQGKESGKDTSARPDAAEVVDKYRREVGRFGSSALHKRDRKMYETAELVKLGCRKPRNEKMPIGILVKKRKYQKIREQKKKEMDLATGMLVRTRRR